MERVIVAPPQGERDPRENKLFWIERPKVVVPRLTVQHDICWVPNFVIPCGPDGTILSCYDGIEEIFGSCHI